MWRTLLSFFMLFLCSTIIYADEAPQAVWANEAIVATYTFNYQNYIQRQKEIAKYFSSDGWIAYSSALISSGLPDTIKNNAYYVSAVATLPPVLKSTGNNQWEATMPILVLYKNPQYQQKQSLQVTINFAVAPAGQGVRGFAISNLVSKVIEPPCECKKKENKNSDNTLKFN